MTSPQGAGVVRLPFRILAWIVGPILIVAGVAVAGVTVSGLLHGRDVDWRLVPGIGCVPIGFLMIRAARTGRDPYQQHETPRNSRYE